LIICGIRGEEQVGDIKKSGRWTILIDPIDGSYAFDQGSEMWGVMVGFLDEQGILKYSWNLLSTGEIFETSTTKLLPARKSLSQTEEPSIDFYDYGSGEKDIFQEKLRPVGLNNCEITSLPAALWAGWKLYKNNLSALVWIMGEHEKKIYPDYDLIFLDILKRQGYKMRLGKLISSENAIVVVAPTDEDADMLYKIAFDIVSRKSNLEITEIKNKLLL
jgi:hypothetical protein